MKKIIMVTFCLLVASCISNGENKKVKVYILAGQSNMEGKAGPKALAWQCGQDKYKMRYTQYIENGDHSAFYKAYQESN